MIDTDSDADIFPNDAFSFQSEGTTICAKGPNINSTKITGLSFRNNGMTTSLNPQWNLERQRYAESFYDQRSTSYRGDREMSVYSAADMQPRNFHHSYYPGAMSSARSMYNERSGSPAMSIRTIDSNTSVTARDIAFSFQNGNFNKSELQLIKEAYNKYLKGRVRRRIEKRRNIRMFLKGFRRRSGGDSGDQASDSSMSSDDRMSSRTSRSTIYKGSLSSCRSSKTSLSDFKRTLAESNMIRDRTDYFRHNSFKNRFPAGPASVPDLSIQRLPNTSSGMQRDRFRSGILLPSQRFNQSTASLTIPEHSDYLERCSNNTVNMRNSAMQRCNQPLTQLTKKNTPNMNSDSEQEEIFGDVTVMKKTSHSNTVKRKIEDNNICISNQKRFKPSSEKNLTINSSFQKSVTPKAKSNDFIFAKPQLPIKKPGVIKKQPQAVAKASPSKGKVSKPPILPLKKPLSPIRKPQMSPIKKPHMSPVRKTLTSNAKKTSSVPPSAANKTIEDLPEKPVETIISKSAPAEPVPSKTEKLPVNTTNQEKEQLSQSEVTQNTLSESMRPSFIKRKLYTQKIHNADKNTSSDSLQSESPPTNIYSKIQKEKNKARKLVNSQSCLSRDVADDSNLLELIHKVVPLDRMNLTQKTEVQNKSRPTNGQLCDVTSILSKCADNEDAKSDTFTDEEIFGAVTLTKHRDDKEMNENRRSNSIETNNNQTTVCNVQKDSIKIKPVEQGIMNDKSKLKKLPQTHDKQKKVSQKENKIQVIQNILVKSAQKVTQASQSISEPKQTSISQKTVCSREKDISRSTRGPTVVVERLQPVPLNLASPTERNGLIKNDVYKCVKSFWDTDIESDFEATPHKNQNHHTNKDITILSKTTTKELQAGIVPAKDVPRLHAAKSTVNESVAESPAAKLIVNETVVKPPTAKPTFNETIKTTVKPKLNKSEAITKAACSKNNTQNKKGRSQNENVAPNDPLKPVNSQNAKSIDAEKILTTKPKKDTITKCEKALSVAKKEDKKIVKANTSQLLKQQDSTLKIRTQRKPKINKCCGETENSNESINDTTLYRSLRSRQVDISMTSNDVKVQKVTATKKNGSSKSKNDADTSRRRREKTIRSEESKDLPNRTQKKPTNNNTPSRKPRKSDISFTLNTTTRRCHKEIESLLNNTSSFLANSSNESLALRKSRYASRSRLLMKSRG